MLCHNIPTEKTNDYAKISELWTRTEKSSRMLTKILISSQLHLPQQHWIIWTFWTRPGSALQNLKQQREFMFTDFSSRLDWNTNESDLLHILETFANCSLALERWDHEKIYFSQCRYSFALLSDEWHLEALGVVWNSKARMSVRVSACERQKCGNRKPVELYIFAKSWTERKSFSQKLPRHLLLLHSRLPFLISAMAGQTAKINM